jgi:hypothetical protein
MSKPVNIRWTLHTCVPAGSTFLSTSYRSHAIMADWKSTTVHSVLCHVTALMMKLYPIGRSGEGRRVNADRMYVPLSE